MKKLTVILTLCIGLLACGLSSTATAQSPVKKERIEVLYFHSKMRCPSCVAIEKQTKALLESDFKPQLKNGSIVFRSVDITKRENEKTADKYEVTWSSLFVNKWVNGSEQVNNFTELGFTYARTNPAKFKQELKQKIENLLK